jgi:hypothetical protein
LPLVEGLAGSHEARSATGELARMGVGLEPGITIDDLLYPFDREAFEDPPFDLVLFALGMEVEREPWGRPICRRAWHLDSECVHGEGAYVTIVNRLAALAGATARLSSVRDHGRHGRRYRHSTPRKRWPYQVHQRSSATSCAATGLTPMMRPSKKTSGGTCAFAWRASSTALSWAFGQMRPTVVDCGSASWSGPVASWAHCCTVGALA